MAINKKALDAAIMGTPAERVYLCGKDFSLFFCYYFSEYIKYPFAPFHFDFFDDVKKMHDGTYREVAWIGFRECAKTSFAKIYLTWLIVYKKKLYINVDSYSTTNAERILFDVILNLQTNKLIVSDFGHLYNAKRDENETTQKRVNNFVTNHGVRVEAHSTGKSVRGRLHGNQRPDFLLLDDFETNDTKDSKLTTDSIIAHIDEFKSGLDSSANVLYLGNLITEHGSVNTLYERAKIDHRLKVRQIDAETDGKPTWDTKYTMTDIEADLKNEGLTENKFVSLEDKKRQLGSLVYSAEMMNTPVSEKSGIFKKEMFKYIKREDLEKKNTRKFATIDSALSKNAESDATGVVRNYVDEQNFWHVSGKEYRINPKGLIDLIFQLYDENMEVIGIETTAFTQAIQPFFEDECRKRGKYPHIVQLKHGGVMKETRIQALVPYYESKSIYHIEGECASLEQQLYKFPMGKHDDVCPFEDTLILTDKGDVKIKDIKIGDMVLKRKGYRPVIAHAKTGTKEVLTRLNLSMTPNHKVYTERGWISLDKLLVSDIITVCEKQLLSMGLSIEDIQNLKKETTDYTGSEELEQVRNTTTEMYGKNIMVKYLKDFIYTILMKIQKITRLKTYNLSVQQNMPHITHEKDVFELDMYNQIVGERITQEGCKKHRYLSILVQIAKKSLGILKVIHSFIVEKFVKRDLKEEKTPETTLKTKEKLEKNTLSKHIKSFLAKIVKLLLNIIHTGYTMFVLFVGKKEDTLKDTHQESENSKQSNVSNAERIFKVKYLNLAYVLQNVSNKGHFIDSGKVVDVYNFEVEGCKEYFANGILVHNCDALQYQRFIAKSAARLHKPVTSKQTYVYNPRTY